MSDQTILFLTLAGFVAGMVDAIAGGGGLVTVPALLATGMPVGSVLATNKGQSVFGSFTSFSLFLKSGRIDRPRLVPTFAAAVIGSAIGARAVLLLDKKLLQPLVIVLLVAASLAVLVRRKDGERPVSWVARAPRIAAAIIALLLGAYDGFFGPGTGTFLVVAFAFFFGDDLVRASANAKVANFASNLAAFLTFFGSGAIVWRVALPMGVAQVIGSTIGTRLAIKRGAGLVRALTVVMALGIAVRLAWTMRLPFADRASRERGASTRRAPGNESFSPAAPARRALRGPACPAASVAPKEATFVAARPVGTAGASSGFVRAPWLLSFLAVSVLAAPLREAHAEGPAASSRKAKVRKQKPVSLPPRQLPAPSGPTEEPAIAPAAAPQTRDEIAPNEPTEAEPPQARPDVVRLSLGTGVISRGFDYRDALSPNLRGYSAPGAMLASGALTVLPLGSSEPAGARFGASFRYARSIGMLSVLPDGSNAATTYDRWEAGLRVERTPRAGSVVGVIGFAPSYTVTRFLFDEEATAKLLPEAGYGAASGTFDIAFALPGFGLGLTAGAGYVPQTGVTGRRFPRATGGVVRAGAAATVPFGQHFAARLSGEVERFFLSMGSEPGDRFVAGGAVDQYLRGGLDVLLRLLSATRASPRSDLRPVCARGLRRHDRRSGSFRGRHRLRGRLRGSGGGSARDGGHPGHDRQERRRHERSSRRRRSRQARGRGPGLPRVSRRRSRGRARAGKLVAEPDARPERGPRCLDRRRDRYRAPSGKGEGRS